MYPLLKNARWTWTLVTCGLPSLWFWSDPLGRSTEWSMWLANGAAFGCFIVLLYLGFRLADRYPGLIITSLTALCFVATTFNVNAVIFLIYAAGFVGAFRWLSKSLAVTVALLVATAFQAWMLGAGATYWTAMALFMVSVASYSIFSAVSRRHDAVLGLKQREIERLAQIAERERIARELHDSVGHALSLTAVKLHLAEKLIDAQPDKAKAEIQELREVTRSTLREIRGIVHGYGVQSLKSALANGELALRAAGIQSDFLIEPVSLPEKADHALAQVVREALTNIIRHSRATHCRLRLARVADRIELCIADDGVGDLDTFGFGIRSMRDRVEELGGRVAFKSGQGVRIDISLPVVAAANEPDLIPALAR